MKVQKNRLSYRNCIQKLNEIVDPKKNQLPFVDKKENALQIINNYIQQYTLPVLYRYMTVNEYTINSIVNNDVYVVQAEKMNDVYEGAVFRDSSSREENLDEIKKIQRNTYIKSFCLKLNNTLMWSHYGDAHKGICIGYDFSKAPKDVVDHLYPVQYSNTRFSFKNKINAHTGYQFLHLRKSKCWSYEKEFRLIYTKEELLNDCQNLVVNCITEIQFGLRTDPQKKKMIYDIVQENGMIVDFYNTVFDKDSFKLKREKYIPNIQ